MHPSSNPLRTLNGVFGVPKMNHRRDFLRENKLNLRELQKNTTMKLVQQQADQEKQQSKHLLRYQKSQERVSRRSSSQQRLDGEGKRQSRQMGGEGDHVPYRRSSSHHRERREMISPPRYKASNGHGMNKPSNIGIGFRGDDVAYNNKGMSCDKEIQTEDILDEEFLYKALKKCSSGDVVHPRRRANDDEPQDVMLPEPEVAARGQDNKSIHSSDSIQCDYRNPNFEPDEAYNKYADYRDEIPNDQDPMPLYGQSANHAAQYSQQSQEQEYRHYDLQAKDKNYETDTDEPKMPTQYANYEEQEESPRNRNLAQGYQPQLSARLDDVNADLRDNFQNMEIKSKRAGGGHKENDNLPSVRSQRSMQSNSIKKKTGAQAKQGSRSEVRLPRYLEKEKRDKEEARQRQNALDPNCPLGHYALAEEERLAALNAAQKRMETLIHEINRMPMTTETLRMRQRKAEIDKELTKIEFEIRTLSKKKVYMPS